jgi:TPR repeat protein
MTSAKVLRAALGLLGVLSACGGQAASSNGSSSAADHNDHEAYCLAQHFGGDFALAKPSCEAGCEASSKYSCKVLGMMYAGGEGVPKDPARANELYAKACKLGEPKACELAGASPVARLDSAEKECNAGRGADVKESCRVAGEAYLDGKGVPVDRARAEPLLKKACKLGSVPACNDFDWSPKK